ncbi:hypothetical protein WA026_018556 [Henosepilachna vigintioctopunctata]|uniref:Adenosine deaminase domain-containing protein n=1 Tax=Henosepilachna vigintioctopunctata TaxID=420089 RepID=A0AAW1U9S6_9CUCU
MNIPSNRDFCKSLPKIELHAHLNGSLSEKTLTELGSSPDDVAEYQRLQRTPPEGRNLSDCFKIFGFAHKATATPEAVYLATKNVIREFYDDNVIYLELRTTPREEVGIMTAESYVEAVVKAIQDNTYDILVKLILSINRQHSPELSKNNLDVILKLKEKYPNIIRGIDLSGDPHKGNFEDLKILFETARKNGLRTTLHCGEVKNDEEVSQILEFRPDRIGHAPFLHPNYGGCSKNWNLLRMLKIPTEICLTSNIISGTTKSYELHHIKEWIKHDLPFSLNTDDKGVFHTDLSQEFERALKYLHIKNEQILEISSNSVNHSFATQEEKNKLQEKLKEWVYTNCNF